MDREGGVLESRVIKNCDKVAALKFLKKAMRRYGNPHVVVTDKCPSDRAPMKVAGSEGRQQTGLHLNNRAENSHLPFRRRERAISRFRRMRSLQKFVSIHSSVQNHFNHQRNINRRARFKTMRDAALREWRDRLLPACWAKILLSYQNQARRNALLPIPITGQSSMTFAWLSLAFMRRSGDASSR